MAKVLRDANCPHPVSFSATVNPRGALTLLCTDLHTPATAFSPYYEAMANKLNQAFPMGDNPYRPFRPAPNEVQLAIHRLPRSYMPSTQEELLPALSFSIFNAVGATVFAARFLQPDPAKREEKPTTSVVIAVAPADVSKFGSSIVLFSQPRRVEKAHSSSKSALCRNCSKFGHSSPACKSEHPTCPLCGNAHTRRLHRCPNPTCPKLGNLKSVPGCCPASPLKCPNCNGEHPAYDKDCPKRPSLPPPTSSNPLPPSGDDMDEGDDGGPAPAPLPETRAVPPETPPNRPAETAETPRPPPPRIPLHTPGFFNQPEPPAIFRSSVTTTSSLFGNPLPKPKNQRPGWIDGSSPTPDPTN